MNEEILKSFNETISIIKIIIFYKERDDNAWKLRNFWDFSFVLLSCISCLTKEMFNATKEVIKSSIFIKSSNRDYYLVKTWRSFFKIA